MALETYRMTIEFTAKDDTAAKEIATDIEAKGLMKGEPVEAGAEVAALRRVEVKRRAAWKSVKLD